MDNKLTERQEMVYSAIKTFINTNKIPPTRLEYLKNLDLNHHTHWINI